MRSLYIWVLLVLLLFGGFFYIVGSSISRFAYEEKPVQYRCESTAGTITAAIKSYAHRVGANGVEPADNDFEALGFTPNDLDHPYFRGTTRRFQVSSLKPLRFMVTVTHPDLDPKVIRVTAREGMRTIVFK